MQKTLSFQTTNSDFYQVLPTQNSIVTFLKKIFENKKIKELHTFSMVGQGCSWIICFYLA